jgi:hypothetical protein
MCRAYTTRQEQKQRRFVVERLKSKDVATQYRNELESEFQSGHDVQTLNELLYETEGKRKKIAATTMCYTQIHEKKEWFDVECATVNEEKNRARTQVIQTQNKTRAAQLTAMNEYRQA